MWRVRVIVLSPFRQAGLNLWLRDEDFIKSKAILLSNGLSTKTAEIAESEHSQKEGHVLMQ